MNGRRPNVLWISFEDTSPRFGCYGDGLARTPNVDRLAEEGLLYRNAFSTAGVCSPSRCAVITGMYAPSIGAHHHRTSSGDNYSFFPFKYETVPPAYVKLLPEYLRAKGYYCTNSSKTDYQFKPPFTAWDENSTTAHWRNREEGQPFFAVFNFMVCHESGMWQERDPLVTDPDRVNLPPYLPNTPKARESFARHYDNLEKADRSAGEILRQLEEDGEADNTIVFIWSDHGEGIPRSKRWLYDSGTRVPLIVRWPGRIAPGVTEQLVSTIDLAPTVLSLLGLPVPAHMQGQPFVGPKQRPRDYVYGARDRHDVGYDMVRAVRDARYKYIRNYHPERPYFDWVPYGHKHPILQEMWRLHAEGGLVEEAQLALFADGKPPEELYDLASDPHEIDNLAERPEYVNVLERLRKELDDWRARIRDLGDMPEAHMAEMMWPGGMQPQTSRVLFVPIDAECNGEDEAPAGGGRYQSPALLQLYSSTQGASIAYTTDAGERPRWRLYTSPFLLPKGETAVRAKAVRIGYKSSEETRAVFQVD